MDENPIIVWQMPPTWNLPNASPFCMKLEVWLRLAGLPFELRSLKGPPKSRSGKAPYIERPDGSVLSDTNTIIETLAREHQVALDRELTSLERATHLLLRRTMEEHLYFAMLYERWLTPEGWTLTRPGYFGTLPPVLRVLIPYFLRRKVRRDAWGQGLYRLQAEEIFARADADIGAIAELLGDRLYFGGERPRTVDATAFAFLFNLVKAPVKLRLGPAVQRHQNLVNYVDHMELKLFPSS